VISGPIHGTLLLTGSPATSFSQADVDTGNVTYQHDGSATTSDGFEFTVSDGAGGVIGATPFSITVALQVTPIPLLPGASRILLALALAASGFACLWLPRNRAAHRSD
jgi:hypothetical protein